MHTSLLMAAAVISAASLAGAPTLAQERSVAPDTNAPASGSADTSRRADTPPKTDDGTRNRNAGVIETDEGRVAGDPDANDPKDKAQISDKAIENAVDDAVRNASTPTRKGVPDGRAPNPTESRPALAPRN